MAAPQRYCGRDVMAVVTHKPLVISSSNHAVFSKLWTTELKIYLHHEFFKLIHYFVSSANLAHEASPVIILWGRITIVY